jgi:DNA-binding NtrC family response regulator
MESIRVLLVDDEEEFTSALAERLTLRGIETQAISDGHKALEIIRASPPHVIILDMMMPGVSGLEVLEFLKENYPKVGVILLTGHGSARDGMEGMRRGAYDYLVKPVNIEDLVDKIRGAAASVADIVADK